MTFKDMFFNTGGRINRTQFWIGLVGLKLLLFILPSLAILVSMVLLPAMFGPEPELTVAMVAFYGVAIASVGIWGWMMVAVCSKRLHDSGRSAKGCIALLIPILGWFWLLLECGVRPGMPGDNRYGAPPRP